MKKPRYQGGRVMPRQPGRLARPPAPGRPKLSLKSQVDRIVYWALQDEARMQQEDEQRQQDQAAVLHFDVGPNWDSSAGPFETANLEDAPNGGQQTGTALTANGASPPDGFIPPPQT